MILIVNQWYTREIREQFHLRVVQVLLISRAFCNGFGQTAREIIP